jgi:hypothetical protein
MNFLKKLWHGKYSLSKSFWLFGVVILFMVKMPDGIMKMMSPYALQQALIFVIVYTLFVGAYQLIVTVGIWKSSSSYDGSEIWSLSAKAYCIVSLIFLFLGVINIFVVGTFYGLLYLGILFFSAYVLEKPIEEKNPTIKINKNVNVKYPQNQFENKKNTDDEKLWELASKELIEAKREGLWAKCFAEANGDDSLAKATYLKIRVQQLSDETLSIQSSNEVDRTLPVNTKSINVLASQNTVKHDGVTPHDKNVNYSDLSIKNLLENGMFKTERYKNRDLLYLHNGYVGCVYGSLIKVFEAEEFCKKAIKDELIGTKYPKGLVLTIRKDSFEIC